MGKPRFPSGPVVAAIVCLAALVGLSGCGCPDREATSYDLKPFLRDVQSANETLASSTRPAPGPTESSAADVHCLFGAPQKMAGWDHGPTQLVTRQGYQLEYSDRDRIPIWVAERITREQCDSFLGFLKRIGICFKADADLRPGTSANPQDYDHTAFDPGHHAAAADFANDKALMEESFCLSNNAPQAKELNRGIWRELEARLRDWVKKGNGPVYVITGGFFWTDPAGPAPRPPAGKITYFKLGLHEGGPVVNGRQLEKTAVSVPTHFFKIVAWKTGDAGGWKAVAFVFENTAPTAGSRRFASKSLGDHLVDISAVEAWTGLKIFPSASVTERQSLQAATTPAWLD